MRRIRGWRESAERILGAQLQAAIGLQVTVGEHTEAAVMAVLLTSTLSSWKWGDGHPGRRAAMHSAATGTATVTVPGARGVVLIILASVLLLGRI